VTSILLLHADGEDQAALSAYLSKVGYHVQGASTLSELRSAVEGGAHGEDALLVLIQELALPEPADLEFLSSYPLLILGRRRRVPSRPGLIRLDDPYYLAEVASTLAQLEETPRHVAAEVLPDADEPIRRRTPDQGVLLRGIAHALNNPLAAASGWLQLLAVDLGEGDSRTRALNQVRGELQRLERLLQALGLIGGRPSNLQAPIDVESIVESRVKVLEREGLAVTFDVAGPLPRVVGDPAEMALMLDLVLGSFVEERGRVQALTVRLARVGPAVEFIIEEDGGAMPDDCDPTDLGSLLRHCRHSRAIGIALAADLVQRRLEGEISIAGLPEGGTRLSMTMPAADQRERRHDRLARGRGLDRWRGEPRALHGPAP